MKNFNIEISRFTKIKMDFNVVYLSVIVVLILILVYVAALNSKSKIIINELTAKYSVGDFAPDEFKPLRQYNETNLLKEKTLSEYVDEIKTVDNVKANKNYLCAITLMEIYRCRSLKSKEKPIDAVEIALAVEYLKGVPISGLARQIDWIRLNRPDMRHIDRIGTQILKICGELNINTSPDNTKAQAMELAASIGCMFAGGSKEELKELRFAGNKLGLAIDLANDMANMAQDAANAKKTNKKDTNFANIYGREMAEMECKKNCNIVKYIFTKLDIWGDLWEKEIIPSIHPGEL